MHQILVIVPERYYYDKWKQIQNNEVALTLIRSYIMKNSFLNFHIICIVTTPCSLNQCDEFIMVT